MGKGGGGAPPNQQVTSTTSNLPEYAKPYFTNLLKRGQAESYREYTPYQGERISGLTPAQLQTQRDVMGMEQPGQFGVGTGMAGAGGIGSLQYGQQAAGAGNQFFGMAQDPASVQSFMSPYQQSVTDVARKAAIRDAQMAQQQINLGSVRQGTYGGARQALAQGERERGLLDRLAGIQAEGSQKAFEDARRTQQFGSTLGLQGFQTGLQGAQQATQAGQALGQLGTAAQDANLKRFQAQSAVGEQQRALEQQRLDTSYADFLRQRDYPMEQLGQYSALLRGLPLTMGSTQTTYAPPPSIASQIGGLGLAAYGLSGAAKGFADGGSVRSFAEGGETDGPYMLQKPKDIAMEYGGNKQKIEQAAKMGLIDPTAAVMAGMFIDTMRNAQQEEMASELTVAQDTFPQMAGLGATPQAAQMAQMAPQMMPTEAGVAALPLSEDTFTAAGGGMIAFDDGGPVARFSTAGVVGGLPALQGSSGGYQLGIKALMAANPGMTLAQATRLLLGPTSLVAGAGLAATDALMATDKGVGQDAAVGSGYDYGPEIMAGGQPDIPASAGTREDTPGLIDYLRAAGLAPREQVMDPATGKFVDVPAKELFRSASPGLAGVLDKGTAPVVPTDPAALTTTQLGTVKKSGDRKPASEVALATQAGQKLSPRQDMSVADFKARQKEFGITDNVDAELKKQIEDLAAGSKGDREQAKYMAMLQAGLGIMGGTSPYALQNISAGALKGVERYAGDIKDIKKEERDLVKLRGELARAEDARKRGDFKTFQDASDKARDFEFKTAEQATRDRIAGIQENYYAGKLSADSARIAMLQERNRLAGVTNSRNARKQFMDEGGESKLRSEFIKRFGKNWEKDSKLMRSFKQQMDAEINKIAGMSDSGFTSAEDLLGD